MFMFGAFCTLFSTLLVFTASSGRISVDFLRQTGVAGLDNEAVRLRLLRALQIAFPFLWLCVTIATPDTPLALVLIGANANNLLLIPMAYGVVHLAMRAADAERMSVWTELALLLDDLGDRQLHRGQSVFELDALSTWTVGKILKGVRQRPPLFLNCQFAVPDHAAKGPAEEAVHVTTRRHVACVGASLVGARIAPLSAPGRGLDPRQRPRSIRRLHPDGRAPSLRAHGVRDVVAGYWGMGSGDRTSRW